MMVANPRWPSFTGASLFAYAGSDDEEGVQEALQAMVLAAGSLDVGSHRGVDVCDDSIRLGIGKEPFWSPEDILVFKCPSTIDVWEAAPLCAPAEVDVDRLEVKAFFERVTLAALGTVPTVAWAVAHDWPPDVRVRWESGDIVTFTNYVVSPGAWRTGFAGKALNEVWMSDDWPHVFVVRR